MQHLEVDPNPRTECSIHPVKLCTRCQARKAGVGFVERSASPNPGVRCILVSRTPPREHQISTGKVCRVLYSCQRSVCQLMCPGRVKAAPHAPHVASRRRVQRGTDHWTTRLPRRNFRLTVSSPSLLPNVSFSLSPSGTPSCRAMPCSRCNKRGRQTPKGKLGHAMWPLISGYDPTGVDLEPPNKLSVCARCKTSYCERRR